MFRPEKYMRSKQLKNIQGSIYCALAQELFREETYQKVKLSAIKRHFTEKVSCSVMSVQTGEIVVISEKGLSSIQTHCQKKIPSICIFEYIYFARPDSIIGGVSVHHARIRAGKLLAERNTVNADIVIGVPDSGLDAALGFSQESGIPYGIGFIKNKYIGRSFI